MLLFFDTEDSYQQQAVIDGEAALLDILDTAGQVEFTAMRDQYMRCGEGFIICYSVTDRHSFQEASEYRKLIARVRLTEDIPLVLIANKLDLQLQRKVSMDVWIYAGKISKPFVIKIVNCSHFILGQHRRRQKFGKPIWLSILRNVCHAFDFNRGCIPLFDPWNSSKGKSMGKIITANG